MDVVIIKKKKKLFGCTEELWGGRKRVRAGRAGSWKDPVKG